MRDPDFEPRWANWFFEPWSGPVELVGAIVVGVLGLLIFDDGAAMVFGMVIGGLATFFYRQLR